MYTENDLNKLIADVTTEFTAHLAKAEDSFKAKPKDESEKEEPKDEPKKPMEHEKEEDKGVKDQEQQDMSSKEGEGKMPESTTEPKEGEAKPSEGKDGESHGYDEEDMAHMHGMYSSMSPAELKAHHDAVRKCMDAQKAPAMEAPVAPEMAKSEKDVAIAVEASEVSLLKSELEASKAKSDDLKKNLDAVSAFLTKFVEMKAPAGKAITSLDIIAKSSEANVEKPLQKSEIDAKLMAHAKSPTLLKSDRDAINSYYCGSKNIETVRHLLK